MLNWFNPRPEIGQSVSFTLCSNGLRALHYDGVVTEMYNDVSACKCRIVAPKKFSNREHLNRPSKGFEVLYGK